MFIIEGTYKGRSIEKRAVFQVYNGDYHPKPCLYSYTHGFSDERLFVSLKNTIESVDIVAQEQATGGGVQGAAGEQF